MAVEADDKAGQWTTRQPSMKSLDETDLNLSLVSHLAPPLLLPRNKPGNVLVKPVSPK